MCFSWGEMLRLSSRPTCEYEMKSHLFRLSVYPPSENEPSLSHLEIDRSLKFSNQKLQRRKRERGVYGPNFILANPICVGKDFWVRSSSNCIGKRNELNLRSGVFIEIFMPILIGLVSSRCKFDCRHFTVHTHARCRTLHAHFGKPNLWGNSFGSTLPQIASASEMN